jgi:TolA-binding protein
MNKYRRYLFICLMGLSACSIFERKQEVATDTLASLLLKNASPQTDAPQLPVKLPRSQPLPVTTHEDIVANYQRLLTLAKDPLVIVNMQQRLAELEMIKSEQLDSNLEIQDTKSSDQQNTIELNKHASNSLPKVAASSTSLTPSDKPYDSNFYTKTIDAYVALLKTYPDRPDNDEILYQLSKAYELDTQLEEAIETLTRLTENFPDSKHWVEAQFRIAEFLFSDLQYHRAEQAYLSVVENENTSSMYQNSLYMLGWSRFKQEHFDSALEAFISFLDHRFTGQIPPASIDPNTQQQLSDVLRVMSWIFTERGGPKSIVSLLNNTGARAYEHLLYSRLAGEYLAKTRYIDAANSYQAYIEKHPANQYAAIYSGLKVDAYLSGSFLKLAFREKISFVSKYGFVASAQALNPGVDNSQEDTQTRLKQYVHELATHYHALAQNTDVIQKSNALYLQAINYYQQFVRLFPSDQATPAAYYYLAEALNKTGQYPLAIQAYEQSAYQYPAEEHSANAGYGAIHSYRKLLASIPKEQNAQREQISNQKIESQIRFTEKFSDDARVAAVLTKTVEELFSKNSYQSAIDTATRLFSLPQERITRSQLDISRRVVAHSLFELKNYPEAEIAYLNLREVSTPKSRDYKTLHERFAASIYKQAEQAMALEEPQRAIHHFMRIIKLAPDSTIRTSAQYDAIVQMVATKQWAAATDQIVDFRRRFPKSSLNANTPHLLITALQKLERWPDAADELVKLSISSELADEKRTTLFLAAQTYEKAKDIAQSIRYYKKYAHAYPMPLDDALESRPRLDPLYLAMGEDSKRRYWLNKIIKLDSSAKTTERTDRSRYLAAQASLVFAEDARIGFEQIRLKLPIKKSLSKKKKYFDKAINRYNRVLSYQIAEFTTVANFKMGAIYQQLSADLIDSQRPANLNELELEQYEMLLEEQAYPFEEEAIAIHETNAQRSWIGIYDKGVQRSFDSLSELLPARYNKHEAVIIYSDEIL